MGGVHLPKYLGSPISSGTAAHEDPCFDESNSLLTGRVGAPGSGRRSLTGRGAQGPGQSSTTDI
jgi:hypothetical protein